MAGDRPGTGPRTAVRRERTDLYASILEVIKRQPGTARITRISYGAGMPVDRLRSSLDRLVALGLVRRRELDRFTAYELTPRGQEFLTTYWKMRGYVALFGPPDGSGYV